MPRVRDNDDALRSSELEGAVCKYGNHLTPGLAEVRVCAAVLTSFLAGFFRAGDLVGTPTLKTS